MCSVREMLTLKWESDVKPKFMADYKNLGGNGESSWPKLKQ